MNGFFGYFIWKESDNLAIWAKKSGQIIWPLSKIMMFKWENAAFRRASGTPPLQSNGEEQADAVAVGFARLVALRCRDGLYQSTRHVVGFGQEIQAYLGDMHICRQMDVVVIYSG